MTTMEQIRFEKKFIKRNKDDCWEWTGKLYQGYGQFSYKGANVKSSRASYLIYVGNIPKGKCILHKCNNRKCVNPEHLYAGTYKDNDRDSVIAGTKSINLINCVGEKHPHAKLNNEDVKCIKRMLRDDIRRWLIAWTYQVSGPTISNIKSGKTWSHITI